MSLVDDAVVADCRYLDKFSFDEFLNYLFSHHPFFRELIGDWDQRWMRQYALEMNSISWEFEGEQRGGRGIEYNRAQRFAANRSVGMTRLLQLFSPSYSEMPHPDATILDVLGGDGTISRFFQTLPVASPRIISADISRLMVGRCLDYHLPCIRQSATRSLFRDCVLDGVLLAYGSHHLSDVERRLAVQEAHRTLVRGGRFVLHDFEVEGPVHHWFQSVVHPFSRTGHPHPHFSREEMLDLLGEAGFEAIRLFDMDDPFHVYGHSAEEAERNMLRHLHAMYGLSKIPVTQPSELRDFRDVVAQTLGTIRVAKRRRLYVAELKRHALVAVGTKSIQK